MILPGDQHANVGVAVGRMPDVDIEPVRVEVAQVDNIAVGVERNLSVSVPITKDLALLFRYNQNLYAISSVFYSVAPPNVMSGRSTLKTDKKFHPSFSHIPNYKDSR